jgi:hypothetical protein
VVVVVVVIVGGGGGGVIVIIMDIVASAAGRDAFADTIVVLGTKAHRALAWTWTVVVRDEVVAKRKGGRPHVVPRHDGSRIVVDASDQRAHERKGR